MAKGELAMSRSDAQARRRPPRRLPAIHAMGRLATDATPARARTAKLPSPKAIIQKWSRT